MRYAATIDAIQRGPVDNWLPAFAETSSIDAQFHAHWYNTAPWNPFTNQVKGHIMAGAVNQGVNERHTRIQGVQSIHEDIETDLIAFVDQ
jgi:hypothetical protein